MTTQVNADSTIETTSGTKDKKKRINITTKYVEINLASDRQPFQVMEHSIEVAKKRLQKRNKET